MKTQMREEEEDGELEKDWDSSDSSSKNFSLLSSSRPFRTNAQGAFPLQIPCLIEGHRPARSGDSQEMN